MTRTIKIKDDEFKRNKFYKTGTTINFDLEKSLKIGDTIEFELKNKNKKIRNYKTNTKISNIKEIIEFEEPQKKRNTNRKSENNTNIIDVVKKGAIIGSIGLSALLGSYMIKNCTTTPKNINKIEEQILPPNIIAQAIHNNSTYNFQEKDPMLRDLTGKLKYINLEKLSVDKDVLHKTINILSQLNMNQLMQTTNLNGLYKEYTNYDATEINYDNAMRHLWDKKIKKVKLELKPENANIIMMQSQKVLNQYSAKRSKKTNFEIYEKKIETQLENVVNDLEKNKYYDSHNHPEKKRFLKNYTSNLNEQTILAYFLTELFPNINPGTNVIYFNNLLKDAGEDFINNIPALSDNLLSFGPGQLTNYTINETGGAPNINKYLSEENQIPTNLQEFETTNQHINGSISNMIYNGELLMNTLTKANQLKNFNDKFEDLNERQQQILIASYVSAAHHSSKIARLEYTKFTKNATINKTGFENIHNIDLGRVKEYNQQSTRNYLTLQEIKNENIQINN